MGDNHLPDGPFLDQVRAGNNVLADSRAIYDDIDTRFRPRRLGYLRLVEAAVISRSSILMNLLPGSTLPLYFPSVESYLNKWARLPISVDIINRDQIKIATQLIYACHVSSDAPKSVNTQAIFRTCPSALYCRPGLPSGRRLCGVPAMFQDSINNRAKPFFRVQIEIVKRRPYRLRPVSPSPRGMAVSSSCSCFRACLRRPLHRRHSPRPARPRLMTKQ